MAIAIGSTGDWRSSPSETVTVDGGSNRLFVAQHSEVRTPPAMGPNMTLNGVAGTVIHAQASSFANNYNTFVYWLEADLPASGSYDLVGESLVSAARGTWANFSGVAQVASSDLAIMDNSTSTNHNVTVANMGAGDLAVLCGCNSNGSRGFTEIAGTPWVGAGRDTGMSHLYRIGNGFLSLNLDQNAVFNGSACRFAEASAASKTATVRLASLTGSDRLSVAVDWAWYDAVPATGVTPPDTGQDTTAADGTLTVTLDDTTLNAGQVGYLVCYRAADNWRGIYPVTVVES